MKVNCLSKKAAIIGLCAAAAAMMPAVASADVITGTFSASPVTTAGTPIDLTGGGANLDWVQYGGGSAGTGGGNNNTGAPNKASGSTFSNLIAPTGGYPGGTGFFGASSAFNSGNANVYVSYLVGGNAVTTQNYPATREHSNGSNANIGGTQAASENFSLTLTQPEEIVTIYTATFNDSVVYSALLGTGYDTSGTSSTLLYTSGSSNGVLADGTAWDGVAGSPSNENGLHTGVLTLDVQGSVGEVLTFSAQQFSNTGAGYPNLGIQAVTAAAATPEPASLGVLGIGAVLMLRRRAAR
ncbi:MAG: PEP-CTERM sorting domain-containing protein [Phycisphaerae bacterium]